MALITHRCTKCQHPDYRRSEPDATGKRGPCPCGCKCTPGKSDVAPTFDAVGVPVERIAEPGSKLGGTGIGLCGCDDCKALYAQLTTA